MQPGQRPGREFGILGSAPGDLIALHRRRHVGEQQDEFGSVRGDVAVEALRHGDLHGVGDLGVEGVFGLVAERRSGAHLGFLRRQLHDERRGQPVASGAVRGSNR